METQFISISPETDKLFTALARFQGEVPNLLKTDTVKVQTRNSGSYTFKYTPLDVAIETVQPILAKYGLTVLQPLTGKGTVTTIIAHESGQYLSAVTDFTYALQKEYNGELKPMLSAQDIGGVITYFRRYAFVSILRLAADEDDDANAAIGNKVEKNTKPNTRVVPSVQVTEPRKNTVVAEQPAQEAVPKGIEPVTYPPTKETAPKTVKQARQKPVEYTAPETNSASDSDFGAQLESMTDKSAIQKLFMNTLRSIRDEQGDEAAAQFKATWLSAVQAKMKS